MLSRFLFTGLFSLLFLTLLGQSQPDTELWPQYYVNLPLNKKLILSVDFSNRYSGAFQKETQWIGRLGINLMLNKKVSVAGGYAYSEYFTETGIRTENRPWQQIQYIEGLGKFKVMQRLRLEERFQNDKGSARFNSRLRYQFQYAYSLLKEERLTIILSDEPMINLGSEINGNRFDQNRLQTGLQVKLAKYIYFMPAYLYIYQYQASKKTYKNVNVFRTGFIYTR